MKSVKRIFAMIVLLFVCVTTFAQTKKMSAKGVTVPDWMMNCVILRSNEVFDGSRTIFELFGSLQKDVTLNKVSVYDSSLNLEYSLGENSNEPVIKLNVGLKCAKAGNAGTCYVSFIKFDSVLTFQSIEESCSNPSNEYQYGKCLGTLYYVADVFFVDEVKIATQKEAEKRRLEEEKQEAEKKRIAEENQKAEKELREKKNNENKERREKSISEWLETKIVPIEDIEYFIKYIKGTTDEITITAKEGVLQDSKELQYIGIAISCSSATINLDISEVEIEDIPEMAFAGCKKLKSIKLPNTLKKIGHRAFLSSTKLEHIEIPKSLEEIGMAAFYGCSSLKTVTIYSISFSGGSSTLFYGCNNLETVNYAGNSSMWRKLDIELPSSCTIKYNYDPVREEQERIAKEKAEEKRIAEEKAKEEQRIAAEKQRVKQLEAELDYEIYQAGKFLGIENNSLMNFLKSSVKNTFNGTTLAFEGAFTSRELEIIAIICEDGNISLSAFSNVFDWRNSIKEMDNKEVFERRYIRNISHKKRECGNTNGIICSGNIKTLDLSKTSIEIIPKGVFARTNIESIILPKSLTKVEDYAFYDCSNLKTVKFNGTEKQWKKVKIKDSTLKKVSKNITFLKD